MFLTIGKITLEQLDFTFASLNTAQRLDEFPKHTKAEQSGRFNGYPRQVSYGAGGAPRSAMTHFERWVVPDPTRWAGESRSASPKIWDYFT